MRSSTPNRKGAEVLLHATVYCGIPAGLDAFNAANEVLKEMGKLSTTGAGKSKVFPEPADCLQHTADYTFRLAAPT
jgi:hypothetical protein